MAEEAVAPEPQSSVDLERGSRRWSRLGQWLKRNVTPRLGAAVVLWRIEARISTPLALALVATMGRWPAAFIMGLIMAVWSALFFYLLDGEKALSDLRRWAFQQKLVGGYLRSLVDRRDGSSTAQRIALVPLIVLVLGPFLRAVALHLLRAPRLPSYLLTILGSIPHSLLWTGIILGGLWEGLIWPFLDSNWF